MRDEPPVLRFAPPLEVRLVVPVLDFDAVVLRAPEVAFALVPDDFAVERDAVPPVFFAPDERELLLDLRAAPPLELLREELEELRAPPLRDEVLPSSDHLPDMTRCAASATASAISDPSLVALDITDFAALSAVSAASMPASLIAFRAFGLVLIAAAAAARPAASISLLIAASASFWPVDFDELDLDLVDFELLRVLGFAIENLPFGRRNRQMNPTTVPLRRRKSSAFPRLDTVHTLKGTAAVQRSPRTWSAAGSDGRPFSDYRRTPLSDLCAEP